MGGLLGRVSTPGGVEGMGGAAVQLGVAVRGETLRAWVGDGAGGCGGEFVGEGLNI